MADETYLRPPEADEPVPTQPMLAEPAAAEPEPTSGRAGRALRSLLLPVLAILSAFVVGALIIILSDAEAMGLMTSDPLAALARGWTVVMDSYGALLRGSIGDPVRLFNVIVALDWVEVRQTFGPLSETIVSAIP